MQIQYLHFFLQTKTSKTKYHPTATLTSPSEKYEQCDKNSISSKKSHLVCGSNSACKNLNFHFCIDTENLDSYIKKRMLNRSDPYNLRKLPQAIHHQKIRPPCPPLLSAYQLLKNLHEIREVQF